MNTQQLADIYVLAAFTKTALPFITESHWLYRKQHGAAPIFPIFLETLFRKELACICFFRGYLEEIGLKGFKDLDEKLDRLEKETIKYIRSRPNQEQREFSRFALTLMSALFAEEERWQPTGISLYRTFDRLDEVFELNYDADHGMKIETIDGGERLYEGAGVGVQSGYSTVLTALNHLQITGSSKFVDLGSGYGRVGLVVGLLRPDIHFVGYEYVPHRVQISAKTAERFEIQDHVKFQVQDLSLKDFSIPEAEIYYLYDPFSEETYSHVLHQLIDLSRRKPFVIVTKGNARKWLLDVAVREKWSRPLEYDSGNLCLFHTAGSNTFNV
ncbi:class I SAM-dependent methyltransferase [Bdellovibrio sp. SKB1291214]|uniref:methyltransferase n=1 Tax=Bdellovibrio sp. SKB1291214 TaxID=1732569 RepID=UPI001C3E819B|nr:methyltransferase [Bdellovibrio sp. SKB1291214]UYL10298.1 class I SAM-dependent methyltransferase [Bdellovibrio sp. SKB1291214]